MSEQVIVQYLTFLSGEDLFGVNIDAVNEIIEISQLTHVPKAPNFIRGVIDLRGGVVPVVDLQVTLNEQVSSLSKRSCIVLVMIHAEEVGEQTLGLLVDEVREIVDVPLEELKPAPSLGDKADVSFIQSMAQVGDQLIILLDVDQILHPHQTDATLSIAKQPQGAAGL